jgi:hypothetical protein
MESDIMRDQNGTYYHPNPADQKTRVYVRRSPEPAGEAEFRLWHQDHPEVWEKHGWIGQTAIETAAALYRERGLGKGDPGLLYDLRVARALLKDRQP